MKNIEMRDSMEDDEVADKIRCDYVYLNSDEHSFQHLLALVEDAKRLKIYKSVY
jgi:hypothetical protein